MDRVINAMLRMELAISGLDGMMEKFYRRLGWRFFTRFGLGITWFLALSGILVFVLATRKHTLLDVGGAGIIGLIAAILGYSLSLTVHELAHALATKSYGRKVPRGGFMIMMGMPYAFVDTTDMWFEGRGPRIVVSLAGPVATIALAFFFALAAAFVPNPIASGISFQIAFGLYINTLFNFNPLIPLDGYYALSDWLQMPRLREEATSYFTKGMWGDLRNRSRIGRRQVGLAFYGMLAVVGMFLFLLLGIFSWNTRLGGFVKEHVPPPFDTVITVSALLLLFFPVWFGPVTALVRGIKRRARPEQGHV
jgi:putative peptide zinc metalloprotease protein